MSSAVTRVFVLFACPFVSWLLQHHQAFVNSSSQSFCVSVQYSCLTSAESEVCNVEPKVPVKNELEIKVIKWDRLSAGALQTKEIFFFLLEICII